MSRISELKPPKDYSVAVWTKIKALLRLSVSSIFIIWCLNYYWKINQRQIVIGISPAPRIRRLDQVLNGNKPIEKETGTCVIRDYGTEKDTKGLRVLSLNVWGMPSFLGSEDKELRIKAVGELINRQEYDLYLLSELWLRADHSTIKSSLPTGFHMTDIEDFTSWPHYCDGVLSPLMCSGLAVISRFPFLEKDFLGFTDRGNLYTVDGEFWAQKGVGKTKIEPYPNMFVDVMVTHTIAEGTNGHYREKQVDELIRFVESSGSDFVILGGDFNTTPQDNEHSYGSLKKVMSNSMEEFFFDEEKCLCPELATYGNPRNNYSSKKRNHPALYDYIWYKARDYNRIYTKIFNVPILTAKKDLEDVSLSDHEALSAHFILYHSGNK